MTDKLTAPWTPDQVDRKALVELFEKASRSPTNVLNPPFDFITLNLRPSTCAMIADLLAAAPSPPVQSDPKGGFLVVARAQSSTIELLHTALEESVKLQSHYARLMNDYDGGARLQFANADAALK